MARKSWRCFHCDEVFRFRQDAEAHFGKSLTCEAACQIKTSGEHALLKALRNAEALLARYRAEDSDIIRCMYSMEADHQTALRLEEEKGYARGLRDGSTSNVGDSE